MFIDANDDKWRLHMQEPNTVSRPLSVCFSDEFGNSFLHRVKECMGKSIVMSLSVPFHCFVEDTKTNHEKREGFLVVNDYKGMVIAYGLARKWREDFIPLLRKQDIAYLRKKQVLCFLDYGNMYVESSRNLMIQKEDIGKALDFPFLARFGKSPVRFHHAFSARHTPFGDNVTTLLQKGAALPLHPLCQQTMDVWAKERVPYVLCGQNESRCVVEMSQKVWKKAFQCLQASGFVRKGFAEGEEDVWVLKRLPVYMNEEVMYIEKKQCEWLGIPHMVIRKAP